MLINGSLLPLIAGNTSTSSTLRVAAIVRHKNSTWKTVNTDRKDTTFRGNRISFTAILTDLRLHFDAYSIIEVVVVSHLGWLVQNWP